MSEAVRTVSANCVILPGRQWLEELTGELTRLGVDPEKAPTSAAKVLQHICARAGWPREVFQLATSDVGAAAQHEVPVSERPGDWTAPPR
jgi:hypothetical protein